MKKSILTLAVLSLSVSAFSATNTTITNVKKAKTNSFLKNTSLGYFSEYAGAKFEDTSDTKGVDAGAWNSIKAKYKVNDSTKVFVAHTFTLNQHEENSKGEDQDTYTDEDFRVGVESWSNYTKAIKFRNRVRLESPSLGGGDVKGHKTARLRASHLVTGSVGRLSLTGVATMRKWFYNQEKLNQDNEKYEIIPTFVAEYSITDKLTAYAEYSQFLDHVGGEELSFIKAGAQEIYLGANYNVGKALTVGVFGYLDGSNQAGMNASEDSRLVVQLSGSIF